MLKMKANKCHCLLLQLSCLVFAAGLAGVCRSFGVPLIVDEAHGSHFAFDPAFPQVLNLTILTLACGTCMQAAVTTPHHIAAMLHAFAVLCMLATAVATPYWLATAVTCPPGIQ